MKKFKACLLLTALVVLNCPDGARAQDFTALGTRAKGMGGAFVGVADDATGIYWNPAGLAAGSFFSLVLDRGSSAATPDGSVAGTDGSSWLLSLTTPALGIGYYRVHGRQARAPILLTANGGASPSRNLTAAGQVHLDSLITHHAGVNLVQSITEGVAVGATLKLVRGIAATQVVPAADAKGALDGPAAELLGRAGNRFDVDLGIMAYGGPLKVGLALRNLREPEFATLEDAPLRLERQVRAGASYAVTSDWLVAADADLTRGADAFGDRREVALGVEGRLAPRVFVRSGVAFDTIEEDASAGDSGRTAVSVGGSYAVRGAVFLDGHFTAGGDRQGRGWGIAARFVY